MDNIRAIYENPRTSTRDAVLLAKRSGVDLKTAQAFLRNEASSQTSAQWKKPPQSGHNYSPTGAPAGNYQADVIFLEDYKGVNAKRKAILTVMNTTSRYAAARPLLNNKAPTVAAALEDILDQLEGEGRNVVVLRVDGGSEFKGATTELLNDRGINIEACEPYTHYRLARTDRFHKTLRRRLGELFEREGSHQWVEALPDIISNMNDTPHRTLSTVLGRPTASVDVTPTDEDKIRAAEALEAWHVRLKTDALGIVPGETQVRLLVRATKEGAQDKFAKSQRAVWTPDVYTVLQRNGPNSWVVDVPHGEVKIWPTYAMQVVDTSSLSKSEKEGPSVDIDVERAKRLEERNISADEQAAAIAAPAARDKRDRKPRVDYARLAKGGGRRYTLY